MGKRKKKFGFRSVDAEAKRRRKKCQRESTSEANPQPSEADVPPEGRDPEQDVGNEGARAGPLGITAEGPSEGTPSGGEGRDRDRMEAGPLGITAEGPSEGTPSGGEARDRDRMEAGPLGMTAEGPSEGTPSGGEGRDRDRMEAGPLGITAEGPSEGTPSGGEGRDRDRMEAGPLGITAEGPSEGTPSGGEGRDRDRMEAGPLGITAEGPSEGTPSGGEARDRDRMEAGPLGITAEGPSEGTASGGEGRDRDRMEAGPLGMTAEEPPNGKSTAEIVRKGESMEAGPLGMTAEGPPEGTTNEGIGRGMDTSEKVTDNSERNEVTYDFEEELAAISSHSNVIRSQERKRKRLYRASLSPEKKEQIMEKDRTRKAKTISSESPEKLDARRSKVKERQSQRKELPKSRYVGRRVSEIVQGNDIIPAVNVGRLCNARDDTYDPKTVTKCPFCDALRWKKEPKGICCNSGKVSLEPLFDDFPVELKFLFCDRDAESMVFRKFLVQLNNALSLCSLKVTRKVPPGGGFNPCVVMQGKPGYLMGPLKPLEGQPPVFAQLYVLDPEIEKQEIDHRMSCLYLPKDTSEADRLRLKGLLERLQSQMKKEWNPYVKDLLMAVENYKDGVPEEIKLVIDAEQRPAGQHERRYNKGYSEISVVFNDQDVNVNHDVVLQLRNAENTVRSIPDTNRAVDSFRFILFFPTGADGWHLGLRQSPGSNKRCTGRMFYGYHIQVRHPIDEHFTPILRGKRLTQEYMCLAEAKVENQDLKYHAQNQQKLRADKFHHAIEAYRALDGDASKIGKLAILPSSHVGSPRYYHARYQDAMALVRTYGKPDLFITMTCNPQWPEITESLLPGQTPMDRPDIGARVYRLKMNEMHKMVKEGQIFGRVSAQVNKVEWQKRGLPHNHQLVILEGKSRIRTPEEVDQVISAELPPDPADFPEGSEARAQAERLLKLVLHHMVHVCSQRCKDEKGVCKKGFPKALSEETEWDDDALYPKYRRRKGRSVEWKGKMVTNRDIVPYNPFLLLKFECHINVECCVSVATIKYLYLYIHKGGDRVMIAQDRYNEIRAFQDCRSLGASEAAWRLLGFLLGSAWPTVIALRVHLEEGQNIYWTADTANSVFQGEAARKTELTAWFDFNGEHPEFQEVYVDAPRWLTYDASAKKWRFRKNQMTTVGRVHTVHPASGDEYYLRILLHHNHCKGKTSFEDLRTIEGHLFETYREVCEALGLLQDDGEYEKFLTEAAFVDRSTTIRSSFITILRYCDPESPQTLFENHWEEWNDDLKLRHPSVTTDQLRIMVLLDLETRLQFVGKELKDYQLPDPSDEERAEIARLQSVVQQSRESVVMQEELNFDFETVKAEHDRNKALLNADQRQIYDEIMDVLSTGLDAKRELKELDHCCYFIDARGGTGKTFLLNTILAGARTINEEKNPAIGVAYSGVAATLMPLGKTFHSRFKVPIAKEKGEKEIKSFNIKPTDVLAKVIAASNLIVWDEGPMANRMLLEGLDETLRDILGSSKPFGGKVIIIAGDFRQILPVMKRASRAEVVGSVLNRSPLFKLFKIRKLTINHRIGSDPARQHFDNELLDMGNGTTPVVQEPDWIRLPPERICPIDETTDDTLLNSLTGFVDLIFDGLRERAVGDQEELMCWLAERAILAPKNSEVDGLNCLITQMFPGEPVEALSADFAMQEDDAVQYPTELLNREVPSGIPPHKLVLKVGIIVILLRNLNPKEGLCNGTRLMVMTIGQFMLECKVVAGPHAGTRVLLPRLDLIVEGDSLPLKWKRRQFPIRVAFAITINKSQGQTMKKVGVLLRDHCFTHGMLYVASSRVGDPNNLFYAVSDTDNGLTRNVVYHDVLLEDPFKNSMARVITKPVIQNPTVPLDVTPIAKATRNLFPKNGGAETQKPPSESSAETFIWSINTNSVPIGELSKIWDKPMEEIKKHFKLMGQRAAHSCGPDSLLDTLYFCIAFPTEEFLKYELCAEHGYDPYCDCGFCESLSPFMLELMKYSSERKNLNKREDLIALNNTIWDRLCLEFPADFEPKGRGDAAIQSVPKLLALETTEIFIGVKRVLRCCDFAKEQTMCPLELFESEEETHKTLEEVIAKELLWSPFPCPHCGQLLLGGDLECGEFVILNLSLPPCRQNEEPMMQEVVSIGNERFRMVGCIKRRASKNGSVDHFYSIVQLKENGMRIVVLDDMKKSVEEFPTFLDCLMAKSGSDPLLDGICLQVYQKIRNQ